MFYTLLVSLALCFTPSASQNLEDEFRQFLDEKTTKTKQQFLSYECIALDDFFHKKKGLHFCRLAREQVTRNGGSFSYAIFKNHARTVDAEIAKWLQSDDTKDARFQLYETSVKNDRYMAVITIGPGKEENRLNQIRQSTLEPETLLGYYGVKPFSCTLTQTFSEVAALSSLHVTVFEASTFELRESFHSVFSVEMLQNGSPVKFEFDTEFCAQTGVCLSLKGKAHTKSGVSQWKINYEYDWSDSDTPRPLKWVKNSSNAIESVHYKSLNMSPSINETAFFLPFYGIPEPKEFQSRPILPFWGILAVAGLFFLAISIAVPRFITKRRENSEST